MLIHHAIPVQAEIDAIAQAAGQRFTVTVPGVMRGKGRPRFSAQGGKPRAYTDAKTANAETWVKSCAIEQAGQPRLMGPLAVTVVISVPIPTSWSKREKAEAAAGRTMPTGKPDADNCLKLVCDALNGILWRDDSQICEANVRKAYGEVAETVIQAVQL